MKIFAQIEDGRLHWRFEAEELPDFAPGFQVVEITGHSPLPEEGWIWDAVSESFSAPSRSFDELVAIALQERDRLLDLSNRRITPLLYAVDAGIATAAEEASLGLWKQFVIDVNRVPQQAGYPGDVTWPNEPQDVTTGGE